MQFCAVCDNMLFMNVDKDEVLTFVCRKCNNVVTHAKTTLCVKPDYGDDEEAFRSKMNANTVHDPTCQRVDTIACTQCDVKPVEMIVVKYDDRQMKYAYMCQHCRHVYTATDAA